MDREIEANSADRDVIVQYGGIFYLPDGVKVQVQKQLPVTQFEVLSSINSSLPRTVEISQPGLQPAENKLDIPTGPEQPFISRTQLENSGLDEISQFINRCILGITAQKPDITPFDLYGAVSAHLAKKIPQATRESALEATLEGNNTGKEVFLWLSMQTILNGCKFYTDAYPEDRDEIVQAAITNLFAGVAGLKSVDSLASRIYSLVEAGAKNYVAEKESIPLAWIEKYLFKKVQSALVDALIHEGRSYLTYDEAIKLGQGYFDTDNLESPQWVEFLRYLETLNQDLSYSKLDDIPSASDTIAEATASGLRDEIDNVLYNNLTRREQLVIKKRFGLFGEEPKTLVELGKELLTSHSRIGQIEAIAIKHLRHPSITRKLRDYRQ